MSMRILIAPSGFKESLQAEEVADAIEQGIRNIVPTARIIKLPLVDGGEGFARTLTHVTGGTLHQVRVTGPVGQSVTAEFGFLGTPGPRTAVMEMAAAAGLRLVPATLRNPLLTTTYGVGEMISRALDLGAERILFGCGDSGTNDGGAGMLQALGARLLRADGSPIARGGLGLLELAAIDLATLDARLLRTPIEVACNPHNWLCGATGVARVFGPQKGASPETVQHLEDALERYADVIAHDTRLDARMLRGGGASGGLGTGLSLLGATLYPRFDIVTRYLDLERALAESDLVITAEGAIDFQTPNGKIPAEVARRAKRQGLPVIALAGTLGNEFNCNYAHGIDAMNSVLQAPCSLAEAMSHATEWLIASVENLMRMLIIGMGLTSLPRAA